MIIDCSGGHFWVGRDEQHLLRWSNGIFSVLWRQQDTLVRTSPSQASLQGLLDRCQPFATGRA